MKIIRLPAYVKQLKRIGLTLEQAEPVEDEIAADVTTHPIIPGSGGLRKARIALPGRGKRGGGRVVFFVWQAGDEMLLLAAYAKNDREDLTVAERRALRHLVEAYLQAKGS